MTPRDLEQARRLLCALQDHIRDTLVAARKKQARSFAKVAAVTAADTIYHIDRLSEHAILSWFDANWPKQWPVEVVMEGLEEEGSATFPRGTPVATAGRAEPPPPPVTAAMSPISAAICSSAAMRLPVSGWVENKLSPPRDRPGTI